MCGIAGIVEQGKNNSRLMDQMLEVIAHRGPDASTQFAHANTVLGHRRLSIIDLSTGDQPMFNPDRSLCIVYNGELYNYRELKRELEAAGLVFQTNSDTEVILRAYEHYGTAVFARFNGIFAFAIYHLHTQELLLVRDQFGIKPLHYFADGHRLIFASEQKAIIQHPQVPRGLNRRALHLQLNLRYTQGSETLFEGIRRLPPAHYMRIKNGQITTLERYWQLQPVINHSLTENEAIDQLQHHLQQAVQRQLISDVPLGVYLSGGLDSSTLVEKMHALGVPEINTFTLGFNEPTDEFPDAQRIADHFQTNHRTLNLQMDPLKEYPQVIWHAEEPKINLLQGYNMSRFVRQHVTVALGGLGGDELLAGYDIHKFIYPFNRWHRRVPAGLQKLLRWKSDFLFKIQNGSHTLRFDEYRRGVQMLLSIGQIERFYLIIRNVWDFDSGMYDNIYHRDFIAFQKTQVPQVVREFESLFAQSRHLGALDQVLFTEFQSKMVNDYLLVEDRMSMAHSIEERVPFLDLDLVNFGFSIPVDLKIRHNQTKYLFRKAMEGRLPPKIITKKKWGFTVNPYLQFKKDLGRVAEQVLTKEYVEQQGIFNYAYLRRILDYPPHPKLRWHYNYLWVVLGVAIWERMFLEGEVANDIQIKL